MTSEGEPSCTNHDLHTGQQRGTAGSYGVSETDAEQDEHGLIRYSSLITRRSHVRILPPPLDEMPGNIAFPGISSFQPQGLSTESSTGSGCRTAVTWQIAIVIR